MTCRIPILLAFLASASIALGETLTLHLVDESNQPVTNATVGIGYFSPWTHRDVSLTRVSDKTGKVVARIDRRLGFFIRIIKHPGFYDTDFGAIPPQGALSRTVVMRHIIHPIPLYALSRNHSARRIPSTNEWLGYDFEVADWVAPHGKGKNTDIRFRFNHAFRGYQDSRESLDERIAFSKRAFAARKEEWTEAKFKEWSGKWDAELDISFPGDKEGLLEETNRFLSYCTLKMPHQAPTNGYQPTWHYSVNNYSRSTTRENVGFFLRTRVKLDESGKIVSANYAKIMGDISIMPAGGIAFTYYYNPTPNDRNLEFNPRQNLFPHGRYDSLLAPEP